MPQYEVSVLRTSHQWATHTLTAASEAEARATTLDQDLDFKEKSCDYSVEGVRVIHPTIEALCKAWLADETDDGTFADDLRQHFAKHGEIV